MDKIQIPFSFLRENPCSYCGQQISGGQVFLLPDGNILCERCKNSKRPFCRNLAYEALASNFVYPCINWQNHCPNVSEWKDAPYHISKCSYGGCCILFFAHPGSCFKGRRRFPEENQRIGLLLVPDKVLSFLTCKICKAYLNCEPVYSQSQNENICFRCVRNSGRPPNSVRNHAYENIATLFMFPCSFRRYGCEEILYFGKAAWKHEFECPCNPATAKPIPRLEEKEPETPRQTLRPIQTEIPRAMFQPLRHKPQAPAIPQSRPVYRNPSPEELQPQGAVYQNQPPQEFPETSHYRTPYTQPPGQVYRNSSPEEAQETPRSSVQPKQKKKGLIVTQTGQIWATLSPNTPLMAPPQRPGEEANKEVMESLRKRQGKHRRHVNDIEGDMNRGGASDSESVSTTMSHTALTTPDLVESSSKSSSFNYLEDNNRLLNGNMMHNRLNSVDSYESDKYSEAELAGHYPVIPRHQRNNIGRVPSAQISRYDAEIASHFPGLYNLSQNRNSDTEMAGLHRWGGQRQPVGYHEAEIAGHFPIMLPRRLNSGMDSIERRQSARDAFLGNSALISELKVRQDFIKRNHSIKEPVQPTVPMRY